MVDEKLILSWDGNGFNPLSGERTKGIYLELQEGLEQWLFSYSDDQSLISRRTALRRANEIAKVGFVHPVSGARVGIGLKCSEEKDPYHNLPDKVTRAEHDYNK
jgi:hypothetical protein